MRHQSPDRVQFVAAALSCTIFASAARDLSAASIRDNGHLDVIEDRTLSTVIVAVAINDQKQPLFTPDEAAPCGKRLIDAVRGTPMNELLVEFAASEARTPSCAGCERFPFEFEFQMA